MNTRPKMAVMLILQVPVLSLLWLLGYVNIALTKLVLWLDTPLSPAGTKLRAMDRTAIGKGAAARPPGECELWRWLEACSSTGVRAIREAVEKFGGIPQAARRENPHLYAVTQPTRAENMERIKRALDALPANTRQQTVEAIVGRMPLEV